MTKAIAIVVALLLLGGLAWVTVGPWRTNEDALTGSAPASLRPAPLPGDTGLAARGSRDAPAPGSILGSQARGRVVDAEDIRWCAGTRVARRRRR
jgi:hypothetical protein